MKNSAAVATLLYMLLSSLPFLLHAQNDTLKYLFLGHPRDDNKEQGMHDTVEKLDYGTYKQLLLGGDLTWDTSGERSTLAYCDRIFDLPGSQTHWALGNHDVTDVPTVMEYTQKPRFYAYYEDKTTFLILDTEITSPDFTGDQLQLIRNVTDTITNSDFLVLVHHRIVWMIGNDDLEPLLKFVGTSTSNLTSTNFYEDVFPLLQDVRDKGLEVLCLGGDRTDVNIEYSPEDRIHFLASGMRGTAPDDENFVIELKHHVPSEKMTWQFTALSEMDTISNPILAIDGNFDERQVHVFPNPTNSKVYISFAGKVLSGQYILRDLTGKVRKEGMTENGTSELDLSNLPSGTYILQVIIDKKHHQNLLINRM